MVEFSKTIGRILTTAIIIFVSFGIPVAVMGYIYESMFNGSFDLWTGIIVIIACNIAYIVIDTDFEFNMRIGKDDKQ